MFSVVIPTHNRAHSLEICLASLNRQVYDPSKYEVIVVDDGSDDDVFHNINPNSYKFILKLINIQHSGPSVARNKGVECANNEYIVFFEDDVVVDQFYLQNAERILTEEECDVIEGLTVLAGREKSIRRYDGPQTFSFIPCNLIVRKKLFHQLGGYNPCFFDPKSKLYFREDAEFGFRILGAGARIMKSSVLIVEHPEQFITLSQCYRHAKRYYFDPLLYKLHPEKYRTMIEVKTIMGFTIHRPLHYLSLVYIGIFVLLLVLLLIRGTCYIWVGIGLLGILASILERKYFGSQKYCFIKRFRNIIALGILPFIYIISFTKGVIKYKSFGCVI